MTPDLEALASQTLSWMSGQSADTEAELYLERSHERTLTRRDGARDGVEIADGMGAGVRVFREGRIGFATAGGCDLAALKALWTQAVGQLSHTSSETGRRLPAMAPTDIAPTFVQSLHEEINISRSWDELERGLCEAEGTARANGLARVIRSDVTQTRCESVVANTRGMFASQRGDFVSVSVSAAVEDGGETHVGEGWRGARWFNELDFAAAGVEAARRSTATIGARKIRAGRRSVVFAPWVGAEFLETIAELLSAEEVEKGRSLLAGRRGTKVACALLTLCDDPRLVAGWGSAVFDDEGVSTRAKILIEKGVLRELFDDCATAQHAGRSSNGCAYRDGFDSLPKPGASNLFIAPGQDSPEALIAGTTDGLLVYEVLGMHMVDPVSGEFSVGISGHEIRQGVVGPAFKGAMLAGNLLELLAQIDAVANDLTFYEGLGAPTFRVEGLDAA